MKFMLSTVLACLVMLTVSCSTKSSKEVVVYTTVDQVFSEPVLKDFEDQTGIKVKPLFDTEETKSTGVLNRIIAEKDNIGIAWMVGKGMMVHMHSAFRY